MQKIPVIQGLQTQIGELQITLWLDRLTEFIQVKSCQLAIEQFQMDATADEMFEVIRIDVLHFRLCGTGIRVHHETQGLGTQAVE